ncbi:hypothetical protein [Marinimicrobium sp. ABcell2]|uniref:hypothetical protein n=1 Tax=Marinimicrobium sp. ABcell2 TaxID=3069751 RepID=UPI0027B81181|nr:hypothetical protein [Marinimicrobium sp. ABcell2]MDQ2075184.1 hypothetical protein [Marinimicrobium sp. ABcell2]
MKLFVPALILVLCGALTAYHYPNHREANLLNAHHQQINSAAEQLDLDSLASLRATASGELEVAYIDYRLALAAEAHNQHDLMHTALSRSEAVLKAMQPQPEQIADAQALMAAIHLRRMVHSDEPEPHWRALEMALTLGYHQEASNPSLLMVSAMAARYSSEEAGGGQAMADLMLNEAGIQFERLCSNVCGTSNRAYIWQGLAQTMHRETGAAGQWLLAQASCQTLTTGT